MQKSQPLSGEVLSEKIDAGCVAARPGEAGYEAKFDRVLTDNAIGCPSIDEPNHRRGHLAYQDTNRLQAKILLNLKPDGRGVTVVGDDAQAIYSFRAATVRNILDFPNQFEPRSASPRLSRTSGQHSKFLRLATA